MTPNPRNRNVLVALATVVLVVLFGLSVRPQQRPTGASGTAAVTDNGADAQQLDTWMRTLSNWGRWGAEDELGAVNLITPEKRLSAAGLIQTGTTISLARPHRIVAGGANNPFNIQASISPGGTSGDRITVSFHGVQITHVDALCHFSYKGQAYNGYPWDEVITADDACKKLGIGNVQDRLVTRAVLIDIPRLKGLPYLEPGTHVYRGDIEEWERRAHVRLGPGDALLLRTGRWAHDAAVGPSSTPSGYDLSAVPLFKDRDISIIGSDWTHDVGTIVGAQYAVHRFAIVARGMTLLDNLDLEELATQAAAANRWEFFLVVAPATATNGTGAPVDPIVVF